MLRVEGAPSRWHHGPKRQPALAPPLWAMHTQSPQTLGHSGPCLLTSFLYREQGGSLSSLGWARLGQWRQPRNKGSFVPSSG